MPVSGLLRPITRSIAISEPMIVVGLTLEGAAPSISVPATVAPVEVVIAVRARPRFISVDLIWFGVQDGLAWMMVAIAPETTPAAIEVPPTLKYAPSVTHCGHSDGYWLF